LVLQLLYFKKHQMSF